MLHQPSTIKTSEHKSERLRAYFMVATDENFLLIPDFFPDFSPDRNTPEAKIMQIGRIVPGQVICGTGKV